VDKEIEAISKNVIIQGNWTTTEQLEEQNYELHGKIMSEAEKRFCDRDINVNTLTYEQAKSYLVYCYICLGGVKCSVQYNFVKDTYTVTPSMYI
jgi:hypothetical protein